MARSVFYGVGAFVGSITGPTTCAFWPDDPVKLKWDPKLLVQVDLAKNPEACRQGKIKESDIEVDDFAGYGTDGMTRVGPLFPGGATMGIVYIEDSRCAACGASDPRKNPRPHEWMTVVYHDGALTGRRFYGFYGEVKDVKPANSMALISLWPRGTSGVVGQTPFGTYWLDTGVHLHPHDPTLPMVPITVGQKGGVFVDSRASGGGVIKFDPPKVPSWVGGVRAPEGRRVR
ncbi:MAG TPA: hypothetical protein VLT45_22995 [Kofleriaceae bacterium]|nr:hypothetical protein [Kofleriaceae bacterium]